MSPLLPLQNSKWPDIPIPALGGLVLRAQAVVASVRRIGRPHAWCIWQLGRPLGRTGFIASIEGPEGRGGRERGETGSDTPAMAGADRFDARRTPTHVLCS